MASKRQSFPWAALVVIIAVLALIIALPDAWKPWAPSFLKPQTRLGLDLAGGTQLDFRISEDEINARIKTLEEQIDTLKESGNTEELRVKEFELMNTKEQHQKIVEAIRLVLERRINSLGVSEATITPSYFGSEKHLLVECPGIIDVERCIQTVGKTIQLEFKEEFTGSETEYAAKARAEAEIVYKAVTTGTGTLQVYGQDYSSRLGVRYVDSEPVFVSSLPKDMQFVADRSPEAPVTKVETSVPVTMQDQNGQMTLVEQKGIFLVKVLEPKKQVPRPLTDPATAFEELKKTMPGTTLEQQTGVDLTAASADIRPVLQSMEIGSEQAVSFGSGASGIVYLAGRNQGTEEMTASHILIQYKGSLKAEPSVTRTKEEAKARADDISRRLTAGGSFDEIVRTESDGPSKDQGGSIGTINRGLMGDAFDAAAFTLKTGELSDVVETPFGFHIIRADEAAAVTKTTVTYSLFRMEGSLATAQNLIEKIGKGEVVRMEDQIVLRRLFFSLTPTGWKDTDLNGQRFRMASVTVDDLGAPVVQIQFDEEGGKLFQELTKRNIGKQIAIFVGGEPVSAPMVNTEISGGNAIITGSRTFEEAQQLAQDLNTGAIPAPIHLSGQTTIEATLGANALRESVSAAAIGLLILCLFLIAIYRLLGVFASLSLVFYVILLIAAMKLPLFLITKEHVVLSLAGIAGIILSIGMAVDANVLVFERMKEELLRGKHLSTAVELGFRKAWPSVWDGNFSTLITCAILFVVGTSIIRGFSITLSMGILISLFTAMVVTRWFCRKLVTSPLAKRGDLIGIPSTGASEAKEGM
ncbi:MAG: protein translocase subunit SecD [Candidatus Peribacteraceae bacterium]|nr:protein translocase subunit SecD [Candidatus Peribacteraceae bacterium]